MSSRRTAYPERLQLRVPRGFSKAVDRAAAKTSCASPEFVRRVLMAALAAEGVTIPAREA